jgi:hypothetical protein
MMHHSVVSSDVSWVAISDQCLNSQLIKALVSTASSYLTVFFLHFKMKRIQIVKESAVKMLVIMVVFLQCSFRAPRALTNFSPWLVMNCL